MSSPSAERTVIVGAGVAGLTAAWKLSAGGEKCLLVEKGDRIGGMCRSYDLDGITFDLGPHLFFHNPDSAPERLMYELVKNEEVLSSPANYSIQAQRRHWRQPFRLWDPLSFPAVYKKELLLARMPKGQASRFHKESLAHALTQKVGDTCYRDLYAPLLLKKALVVGDQLHRDWLHRADRTIDHRPETPLRIDRAKLVRRLAWNLVFPRYLYPVKGFGIFAEKLWEAYRDTGGETLLGCGEIELRAQNERITTATVRGKSYRVKNVVWTGSANDLNALLGGGAREAKFVHTLVACLTFNRSGRKRRRFVYTYYPRQDVCFNRVYFPEAILGDRTPLDREGVCVEINDRSTFEQRDVHGIVDRMCVDLERLGLFSKHELREYRLFHLRDCMPVHKLDYEEELREIFIQVHRYQNLFSVGRRGGFFFCQTPGAIGQGLKVAAHLLGEKETLPS